MWLDALELLLENLQGKFDLSKVDAISGAAQQHGSVYLNADWLEKSVHCRHKNRFLLS